MCSSDLSVGNMQFRDEAIAAANAAMEQVLSSPFTDAPTAQAINVDINNDGVTDYEVNFAKPTCVSDSDLVINSAPPSSISLGRSFSVLGSTYYHTVWDLDATVTDATASGASVRVREGIRVLLTKAQYTAACL